MRLFVASDIHGCSSACRRLLIQFDRMKGDRLLLLGDILHGGYSGGVHACETWDEAEVARLLRARADRIYAVRGNCDLEADEGRLGFPLVHGLGFVLDPSGRGIHLAHGHRYSPSNPPPIAKGDLFLSGHTHIAAAREAAGRWFLNPGSLALPRGDLPGSFLVLEDARAAAWYATGGQPLMTRDLGVRPA